MPQLVGKISRNATNRPPKARRAAADLGDVARLEFRQGWHGRGTSDRANLSLEICAAFESLGATHAKGAGRPASAQHKKHAEFSKLNITREID